MNVTTFKQNHSGRKLNDNGVGEMIELFVSGVSINELAAKYDITKANVSKIISKAYFRTKAENTETITLQSKI